MNEQVHKLKNKFSQDVHKHKRPQKRGEIPSDFEQIGDGLLGYELGNLEEKFDDKLDESLGEERLRMLGLN